VHCHFLPLRVNSLKTYRYFVNRRRPRCLVPSSPDFRFVNFLFQSLIRFQSLIHLIESFPDFVVGVDFYFYTFHFPKHN